MRRLLALALLPVFLVACSDSPTDNGDGNGDGNGNGNGVSFSATVDGEAWTPDDAFGTYILTILNINATDNDRSITLSLIAPGTGSYNGNSNSVSVVLSEGGVSWIAGGGEGSVSINISTLNQNHATGTFSFTAVDPTNNNADRTVTNGSFSIDFVTF